MSKQEWAPGIHVQKGGVDTAAMFYKHPDGKLITVVGTMHFATRSYFDELCVLIAERENAGACVHYESLRDEYPDDATLSREQKQQVLAVWKRQPDSRVSRFRAIGMDLISHREGLHYSSAWRNVDFTVGELHELGTLALDQPENLQELSPFVKKLLQAQIRNSMLASAKRAADTGGADSSFAGDIVAHARDVFAVQAALRETRDVVMIWGAAHLAAIGGLLSHGGYALVETKWFAALPRHIPQWSEHA